MKNTFPKKSGNHQKIIGNKLESSSTNVHIIGEDLFRVFYKLFYLRFCVSSDQWKMHCVENMLQWIWEIFHLKIILIIKPKRRIKFSARWWPGNKKYFFFCLQRVALYFKGMPNYIDFYKRIFLHVIPLLFVIPFLYKRWFWFQSKNLLKIKTFEQLV